MKRAKGRKLTVYCERHHIKPRSFGGSDKPNNIVILTFREHFLAHWLLTKFVKGVEKRGMCYALVRMCNSFGRRVVAGWQYDIARRANTVAGTGRKKSKEECVQISIRNLGNQYAKGHQNAKGMRHTDEMKKFYRERMLGVQLAKGMRHTEETKLHLSKLNKGVSRNKGFKHSPETCEKRRQRARNPTPAMLEARKRHSVLMQGNQHVRGKTWKIKRKDEPA